MYYFIISFRYLIIMTNNIIIFQKPYKIIQAHGNRTWKRKVEEKVFEVKFEQNKAGNYYLCINT